VASQYKWNYNIPPGEIIVQWHNKIVHQMHLCIKLYTKLMIRDSYSKVSCKINDTTAM
jgi:hypothetical protein